MNFFYIHPFKIKRDPADRSSLGRKPLHDLSEGGEFLDDAIHYEDVQEIPVSYNEDNKTQETIDSNK